MVGCYFRIRYLQNLFAIIQSTCYRQQYLKKNVWNELWWLIWRDVFPFPIFCHSFESISFCLRQHIIHHIDKLQTAIFNVVSLSPELEIVMNPWKKCKQKSLLCSSLALSMCCLSLYIMFSLEIQFSFQSNSFALMHLRFHENFIMQGGLKIENFSSEKRFIKTCYWII